jgi:hypothetical protein
LKSPIAIAPGIEHVGMLASRIYEKTSGSEPFGELLSEVRMIAHAYIDNPRVARKLRQHRIVRRPAMKAQVQRLQEATRATRLEPEPA